MTEMELLALLEKEDVNPLGAFESAALRSLEAKGYVKITGQQVEVTERGHLNLAGDNT